MKGRNEASKDKTNAMRILDGAGAEYRPLNVPAEGPLSAVEAAQALGRRPEELYKTLVTEGKSREHYVFVIPGAGTLDLKKAASAVGEKSVRMVPSKALLPLTGYVHGGCSPVGMKKTFPTVFDASAEERKTVIVSAGRIGRQMELTLSELRKVLDFSLADLTEQEKTTHTS